MQWIKTGKFGFNIVPEFLISFKLIDLSDYYNKIN